MGLNKKQWVFTEKHFKNIFKGKYDGKKMLELGCQEIKHSLIRKLEREGVLDKKKRKRDAKAFFEGLGFEVISVDKCKCFAAIKLDLRDPVPDSFVDHFDIITNYGTTEHIWPRKHQFQAFKNIHDSLKVGGVFIHVVPGYKARSSHARINYGKRFFSSLSDNNNYEVIEIDNEFNRGLKLCHVAACMIKKSDAPFYEDREEFFKHIIKLNPETLKKYKKLRKNPLW